MKEKLKWYLKQLFPLTYHTTYKENGKRRFTVWKMWLGRCYKIESHTIAE